MAPRPCPANTSYILYPLAADGSVHGNAGCSACYLIGISGFWITGESKQGTSYRLPPNLGLVSGVRRSLDLSVEGDPASSRGVSARACHNGVSVDHNAMGNVDDLPRCEWL
jgi:hypothetical protein